MTIVEEYKQLMEIAKQIDCLEDGGNRYAAACADHFADGLVNIWYDMTAEEKQQCRQQ